ncbi:hypothetical protein SODALDRAFT_79528 [Sodiomyces alkalinus F11]|uniref:Uncharacterized protein n=1 Tax=Sodiomyces alkalinus (strain CBS 110278 / VKM F-3762 / F11) TaxID=1314773 RepID=A0A3N2PL10_SODAK|nr:hypothetical protein SODALDRAFT_79528 [Sodiomyces alkalinus F11]ROT35205.1 hypothetical protein SODALDRAFT_79528 [Sodiomyces alkalinus F11]
MPRIEKERQKTKSQICVFSYMIASIYCNSTSVVKGSRSPIIHHPPADSDKSRCLDCSDCSDCSAYSGPFTFYFHRIMGRHGTARHGTAARNVSRIRSDAPHHAIQEMPRFAHMTRKRSPRWAGLSELASCFYGLFFSSFLFWCGPCPGVGVPTLFLPREHSRRTSSVCVCVCVCERQTNLRSPLVHYRHLCTNSSSKGDRPDSSKPTPSRCSLAQMH